MPVTAGHRVNPVKAEPVATATIVPIVVWLLARFGFEADVDTATAIAGALLVLGQIVARQMVTPVAKLRDDDPAA